MKNINTRSFNITKTHSVRHLYDYTHSTNLKIHLPLDGGPLMPPGPPLDPRGPLGGPRLRECMGGGPRLPALSN